MFSPTGESASRGKRGTPFRAREVWVVAVAAILVAFSFWWETAYEFKHAYYIDIQAGNTADELPWHKFVVHPHLVPTILSDIAKTL